MKYSYKLAARNSVSLAPHIFRLPFFTFNRRSSLRGTSCVHFCARGTYTIYTRVDIQAPCVLSCTALNISRAHAGFSKSPETVNKNYYKNKSYLVRRGLQNGVTGSILLFETFIFEMIYFQNIRPDFSKILYRRLPENSRRNERNAFKCSQRRKRNPSGESLWGILPL